MQNSLVSIAVALIALCLVALTGSSAGGANASPVAQVAFLQLRIDSTGVTLVQASIVDGSLKSPRGETHGNGILCEVTLADSTILASVMTNDPLRRRLEYEDPDHPGQLRVKVVELPSAEFTVRIPYRQDIRSVKFYRVSSQADANLKPTRLLLGTIGLSDLKGGK